MTNRLMMSVAAIALIAGTGLANAQATGGREPGGAATQQAAPSAAPAAAIRRACGERRRSEWRHAA